MDFLEPSATAREEDHNGYISVLKNPITRAGVFQYKGAILPGADPGRVYNVLRPPEELASPETLKSFMGLPLFDEHEMVGGKFPRGAEERGVHGCTLENVTFDGRDVLASLRIFSRTMKRLIEAGKKALSLGYHCKFEKSAGEFEGMPYNYIQRNIRGNHLALVTQGRSGTEVLDQHDAMDHFDLALDTGELNMADEKDTKKDTKTEAKDSDSGEGEKAPLTLAEVHKFMSENAPMWKELQALMSNDTAAETGEVLDEETEEKEGDQALDKDEDKEKDKAMDANDVQKIVDAALAARDKSGVKSIMSQITSRDTLAKDIAEAGVGTFDCSAMDTDDVAAYGCEKLGIKAPKGQEIVAVTSYLAGVKKNAASKTGFAMDSAIPKAKANGLLDKRLGSAA